MVKNPCAKNDMLLSKQTEVMGRQWSHVKKYIYKFDLKVKDKGHTGVTVMNVHDASSWVIHPCAKYGMPMSKRVTTRQTDRQTEWFLYTPLNFVSRGYW